ncbi:MAG: ABC transporter permease [Actinomycetota bacterium]|nr:ABC transporter permease [Actinomycetota bacterium]
MTAVRELLGSRELLWNLTQRNLRGRYRGSILGWTWSLLNPLATTAVYWFVFTRVFEAVPPVSPTGLENYALYLVIGLLPWTYFLVGTTQAMSELIGNGSLIRKVWFPREILVASSVIAQTIAFLIELALLGFILALVGNIVVLWIPVILVLVVLLGIFTLGVSMFLASLNVYFRDLSYLWGVLGQMIFYGTPIIYTVEILPSNLQWMPRVNPIYSYISAFRSVMYDLQFPTAMTWLKMTTTSAIALAIGWAVFARLSPRFAEEL